MATRGDLTEAKVLGAFVEAGLDVLVPWRNDLAYDLVVTADGDPVLPRAVQVRRERGSALEFNSRSTDHGAASATTGARRRLRGVLPDARPDLRRSRRRRRPR